MKTSLKCGYIVLLDNKDFVIYCSLCGTNYTDANFFFSHVLEFHKLKEIPELHFPGTVLLESEDPEENTVLQEPEISPASTSLTPLEIHGLSSITKSYSRKRSSSGQRRPYVNTYPLRSSSTEIDILLKSPDSEDSCSSSLSLDETTPVDPITYSPVRVETEGSEPTFHESEEFWNQTRYVKIPVIKSRKKQTVEMDIQLMNLHGFGEFDWSILNHLRLSSESLEGLSRPQISVCSFGKVFGSNLLSQETNEEESQVCVEETVIDVGDTEGESSNNRNESPQLEDIMYSESIINEAQPNTPEEDDKTNLQDLLLQGKDEQRDVSPFLYPEVSLHEIKKEEEIKEEPKEIPESYNPTLLENIKVEQEVPEESFNIPEESIEIPITQDEEEVTEMVEILVPIEEDDEEIQDPPPEKKTKKKPKKKYNRNKNKQFFSKVNTLKVVGVTSLAVNETFDEEGEPLPLTFEENETSDLEEGTPDVEPSPQNPQQQFLLELEQKRVLAEAQLTRLNQINKRSRVPPSYPTPEILLIPVKESVLEKNIMDFIPITDFLEQIFRIWYGDLFLTNICAQQISVRFNIFDDRNLRSYFIFMKFKILLDHWRKKTYLYRKYKSLEEFDTQAVFKKLSFICGFKQHTEFICPVCSLWSETIIDLRRHFATDHLDRYECSFCDTVFPTKNSLEQHINDDHDSEIWFSSSKEFLCIKCDTNFDSDSTFLKHVEACNNH